VVVNGNVVIVSAVRTPFGKFGGALKNMSSIILGATVLREVVKRVNLPPSIVDEVFLGLGLGAEAHLDGGAMARQATLKAGYPPEVRSLTIDRACCSSMVALQLGCRAIMVGDACAVVAGGTENMGRAPYLVDPSIRWGSRLGNIMLQDSVYKLGFPDYDPVSVDADRLATEVGVTREDMDGWALRSQQRYAKALADGKFRDEVMHIEIPQEKGPPLLLEKDEFPKPHTTLEGLARLTTVDGCKSITAGNSPGLDAGASAVLLMSRERAQNLGIQPLAALLATTSVSARVGLSAAVPAYTIQRMLEETGLTLDDLDLIEINEAFAAMPLVSSLVLSDNSEDRLSAIRDKLNVNGGAVAIGHPVGASGTRLAMTLMYELRRRSSRLGAAAICGGLAQGDGVILQVES
jgi:acetyl-CoA C-acetyltransferase